MMILAMMNRPILMNLKAKERMVRVKTKKMLKITKQKTMKPKKKARIPRRLKRKRNNAIYTEKYTKRD